MDDRRKLAKGKKIWVIKAGYPDTPAGKWWSEYAFSHSLKKYLERLGYYVVIEAFEEWKNDSAADVVIVLRGNREYFPDRTLDGRIYVMWNLSHPGQVSDEEYEAYDLVCISSGPYGEKVGKRIRTPVKVVPMCADTEIFYPDSDPWGQKEYDWIFVGNSRYMERKSVTWSIAHQIPLKIWGAGWEKFIPDSQNYVESVNIPNDELPSLYRNAMVTVNDHYEDMISNGFINTRIVEALACGLPVISDYSEVLKEMFGDGILCYRDEDEFVSQTKKVMEDYAAVKEKAMSLWPAIQEKYSFEACARMLSGFVEDVVSQRDFPKRCIQPEFCKECKTWGLAAGISRELGEVKTQLEEARIQLEKANREKEEKERELRRIRREKSEISRKLQRTYEEKSEINRKLQQTYKEKSEINRKLQVTYGEKYDRGLQIKSLEKELAAVRNSRSYRLARLIGSPVRFLRKIMKKMKE